MTAVHPPSLAEPQRQSLWAIVFLALRTLRQVGLLQLLLIAGFVVARLSSLVAIMGLVVAVATVLFVIAALQWWRYTFVIVDDELVVRRGILHQQTLSIPLDRVQSVSLEQKLLHRIGSLVQVSLDTAGTQTAEFVIDAVDRPVADELQRSVANHRVSPAGPIDAGVDMPPPPEKVIVHHGPRRIVAIALTQTPFAGLVLVAPLFAMADEIGNLFDRLPVDIPTLDEPSAGWWLAWFIPLVIGAGLLFSVTLNVIRVVLTEWNLTLTSTAAGLRRNAGLLSTTSVAATVPRVQLVGTGQGVLERAASLQTARLGTIGNANLNIPGCDGHQIEAIRDLVLPDAQSVKRLDRTVSPHEVFLITRNVSVVALLTAVGFWFLIGWWVLLLVVPVGYTWAATKRRVRLRRWGINADALAQHREFLGWQRRELLLRKVNGVRVRQSLFERKRGLATVTLTTAAGAISIGMIPLAQATTLRDEALYRVETDRRAWM